VLECASGFFLGRSPEPRIPLRVRLRLLRDSLGLWVSLPFELLVEFWDRLTGADAGYENCWWDK